MRVWNNSQTGFRPFNSESDPWEHVHNEPRHRYTPFCGSFQCAGLDASNLIETEADKFDKCEVCGHYVIYKRTQKKISRWGEI